ncbi:MAG: MFS transporter, partial [Brevinema sp.]
MKKEAWKIAFIGLFFNMVIGVIFSWSVYARKLASPIADGGYNWSQALAVLPYTIAIFVRSLSMYPAGKLQISFPPKACALFGVLLLSCGLFLSSFSSTSSSLPLIIGFGFMGGIGGAMAYNAVLPVVIKWFPISMVGRVTGLVMFGMTIGTLYLSPISNFFLSTIGFSWTIRILGLYILFLGGILSCFLNTPDESSPKTAQKSSIQDASTKQMLHSPIFYINWFQFFCLASVGLMLTGNLSQIIEIQSHDTLKYAYWMVSLLALFNAFGRLLSGVLFDLWGKEKTLILMSAGSLLALFLLIFAKESMGFLVIVVLIGLSYGSAIALFPSMTADIW